MENESYPDVSTMSLASANSQRRLVSIAGGHFTCAHVLWDLLVKKRRILSGDVALLYGVVIGLGTEIMMMKVGITILLLLINHWRSIHNATATKRAVSRSKHGVGATFYGDTRRRIAALRAEASKT